MLELEALTECPESAFVAPGDHRELSALGRQRRHQAARIPVRAVDHPAHRPPRCSAPTGVTLPGGLRTVGVGGPRILQVAFHVPIPEEVTGPHTMMTQRTEPQGPTVHASRLLVWVGRRKWPLIAMVASIATGMVF